MSRTENEIEIPVQAERSRSIDVCLLGSPASGKTCFLAGLAILAEPDRHSQIEIHARGKHKERLDELAAMLRRQEWPPGTHAEESIESSVLLDGRCIDITVMDYPGGDFQEELRKLTEQKVGNLLQHVTKADTLLLLFDPDLDVRELSNASQAVKEQRLHRHEAFLQVIRDLYLKRKRLDIGIVLSKSDMNPELRSSTKIREFMRQHLPMLMKRLKKYSKSMEYFAVSAVGKTEGAEIQGRMPARELKPYGYEELFGWVIRRQEARKNAPRNRVLMLLVASVLLAVVVFGVNELWQYERNRRILGDSYLSPIEKIEKTPADLTGSLSKKREDLLGTLLKSLRSGIGASESETDLDPIDKQLRQLQSYDLAYHREKVDELLKEADVKRQNIAYQRLEGLKNGPLFEQLAQEFLAKWPAGENSDEVRSWLNENGDTKMREKRASIRREVIKNESTLKQKLALIQEYLAEWGDANPDETERIYRAAAIGADFLNGTEYSITLKASGEFIEPAAHWVRIQVGQAPEQTFYKSTASRIVNWNESIAAKWRFGDAVRLHLNADYVFGNPYIAGKKSDGPLGILLFTPTAELRISADGQSLVNSAYIKFAVSTLSAEDFEIISGYLLPGGKW